MTEKITVIVAVYNTEQYLRGCIESIINQSYQNLEIILVNDGSTDSSGKICDEYKEKDSRVKVIHQENKGRSAARNAGITAAKGNYIAFVDSDDFIDTKMYETLLQVMISEKSDIVECPFQKGTIGEKLKTGRGETAVLSFTAEDALSELILDRRFHQSVVTKLYKSTLVKQVPFTLNKTIDDEFWTFRVFGLAKKVSYTHTPLYFYLQHEQSTMHQRFSLKRLEALEAKEERQRYIEKKFSALTYSARLNLFFSCVYAYQMSMVHMDEKTRKIAYKNICDIIKRNPFTKEDIKRMNRKERLWVNLSRVSFRFVCGVRNFLKVGF